MEASQSPPRPSRPRDLEAVEDGRQSREQLLRENQELREARECRVCRDQEVGTITLDTILTLLPPGGGGVPPLRPPGVRPLRQSAPLPPPLRAGAGLRPPVPGGGLGQARGLLPGQDEEEEAGRSGLTSEYRRQTFVVIFIDWL